jgi:hypothetical protein
MQLLRNMLRGLVVVALAFGLLAVAPKSSYAFNNLQYNLIKIQLCLSFPFQGFDFLVVSDANSGGTLVLGDAVAVLEVAPICHAGNQFYAFLNNGVVTNVAIVPGI